MREDRARICPVAQTAASDPGRPALVSPNGITSYGELHRSADRLGRRLLQLGIKRGEYLAVVLDDPEAYPHVLWAALRLGVILVLLSPREPHDRLKQQARTVGCARAILSKGMEEMTPETLWWHDVSQPGQDALETGNTADGSAGNLPALELEAPATVVFTSGSAGRPKAAVHTVANHWFSAEGSQSVIQIGPGCRWLAPIPFHHVGGLSICFRSFLHGGTVAVPGRLGLEAAIRSLAATHISLVPTQLVRSLDADGGASLRMLKAVLVGGGRTPSALIRRSVDAGIPIRLTYGLTEMSSQVATTPEDPTKEDLQTSGYVLPYREVSISERGEVLVRGLALFAGYLSERGLERPLDRSGWFPTGDTGLVDESGRLTILGRMDGMFVSGGENIFPEEIEDAILNTGLVHQAAVVAVPDPEFGSRPVAFVDPLPGSETIEDMKQRMRSEVASFKVPDMFAALGEEYRERKPGRSELSKRALQLERTMRPHKP